MTAPLTAAVPPPGAAAPTDTIPSGVYDMPAADYHARRDSLSSSGARKLLPPSCPALFRYEQDNGQEHKDHFDFGTVAHKLVLGTGPDLAIIDAADWRTKAAQARRTEARFEGRVPILIGDHERATEMAAAVHRHPVAGRLFTAGRAEQSLFWTDPATGIQRRARPDWLPDAGPGRLIVPDYKTCTSAAPSAIEKSMHEYGYHQQAAWYLDGVRALELGDESSAFVFVFQEKTPPYLITIAQPDPVAMRIGRALNRRALEVYRTCVAEDRWLGYSDDIEVIGVPVWVENRFNEENS